MPKKKKILIAYATAGVGHMKAAQALAEAFAKKRENADTELIDVLDYTNAFFRKTYCIAYLFLIRHLGFLWGAIYYFFDFKIVHFLFAPLRRAAHLWNSKPLVKFILEYKPDVVLSTHFLLPDICYYLKKKYHMDMRVINIITDYRPHSFWISPAIDTYAVGHPRVKEELKKKWGIPDENIIVKGIPVRPEFSENLDKTAMKKKFGINPDSFTVLMLSGGYGIGPVIRLLMELDKSGLPLTAVVICGHNKTLYAKVRGFKSKSRMQVLNLGYVNNVNEFMAASDVCVGKVGGISTSEAFIEGLPFIFVKPIPGQERANADLFVEAGAGIELKKVEHIRETVRNIAFSPEVMRTLKENIKKIQKPYAARDIADYVVKSPG